MTQQTNDLPASPTTPRVPKPSRSRWLRLPRSGERTAGIAILLICALAFIIIPMVYPVSATELGVPALPPSLDHPLGTDELGRDIFARIFLAGRLDLAMTVVGVLLAMLLGVTIGLVTAWLPKIPREIILRLIEAAISIPYIVLVLGISALFRSQELIPGVPVGSAGIVLALVLAGWATFANLTINQALALREREFITASHVLGYSTSRILARHVAPSVMSVNISFAATQAVSNIGTLAGLALLGVSVQDPTPELGLMMQRGIALLPTAPWISLLPGLLILILGVGFGLIADSLNEGKRK